MELRGSMEAAVEFERLLSLARNEQSNSTPSSVHRRYQQRLASLRAELKHEHHEVPLGAILVSIGALSDEQLNRALRVQSQSSTGQLLGEILVEMNVVARETLSHAVAIQSRPPSMPYPPEQLANGGQRCEE